MNLEGKTINFLGDSITEGVGVADRNHNRYDNRLKRECNLKAVYNYGVSGTRLAHQSAPSDNPRHDLCFCGRAFDMMPYVDIVVVYGGVNDYLHGDAPIGQYGDRTPATFYGGVYFLMNALKEKYPNGKVVFLTPARCKTGDDDDLYPALHRPMKLPDAMPLLGYVEIIQRLARDFDIPVLDLYHTLGIDPHDDEMKKNYTADGLHFNDEGHKILADRLREFLEAL